jgi:hypothetical protein
MRVEKWEEALQRAGLREKYANVVEGFRNGFNQGIPPHSIDGERWFTPPNHSSALLAKEEIEENLRKEIAAGRMFGPFTHEEVATKFPFFRSSPLGTATSSDGLVRPINDLSFPHGVQGVPTVNSFVDKMEFNTTWDNFKIVARFFKQSKGPLELVLFDWEKAYRQILTREDQWPYLMVQNFNGEMLLDTRITFGGVAGCTRSFGRPADAWKEIMKAKFDLVRIFRWVDDNLFFRKKGSTTNMRDVVKRSADLGVKTNNKKYSDFSRQQKFIRFVWNGEDNTVTLPPGKKKERVDQLCQFLVPNAKFSYKRRDGFSRPLNSRDVSTPPDEMLPQEPVPLTTGMGQP